MTEYLNVKINITCPVCKNKGKLDIDGTIIKNSKRGISSINILENMICKHSFVVYVDTNLTVRDSFICDFKIKIPELDLNFNPPKMVLENQFNVNLIKLNLLPSTLVKILRGVYFGKEIILISNDDFLNEHFLNFFHSIFKNTFDVKLKIMNQSEYNSNKKVYKNDLVFYGNDIIKDKDKIINSKKNTIEQMIIQKFFGEIDEKSSQILLSNENLKAYLLSILIKEYIENSKVGLDIKHLMEHLKQKYNILKIYPDYLNFLFEIVGNYFNVKIPLSLKITSKLLL
ncbi:MAG: hypothetical protein ACFFBP_18400 [Promethearchaeota archaeon]